MSYDIDPDALASALPAGITYETYPGHREKWRAQDIARFQAARLAESGYRLVYVDDATVKRVAAAAHGAWHEGMRSTGAP